MASNQSNSNDAKDFPAQVLERYEPMRTLGKGGFAAVVLAKRKNNNDNEKQNNNNKLVALKRVAASTTVEQGYAHREIDILNQLEHPNMMKLLECFETDGLASAVLVLSYARGPTLESVLRTPHGAPSLVFGRVVCAQLVDVVGFLHSHAVIHRDIKPDNLIVTFAKNASIHDDDVWTDYDNTDDDDNDENQNTEPDWKALREKWHVTLVDFGFARSLQPKDIKTDVGLHMSVHQSNTNLANLDDSSSSPQRTQSSTGDHFNKDIDDEEENMEASHHFVNSVLNDDSRHNNNNNNKREEFSLSASRRIVRQLSALGNRNYAAPEIINGVVAAKDNSVGNSTTSSNSRTKKKKRGHTTLAKYVSDYGMVADAFSVGSTIRYVLTGVPPDQNVQQVLAAQHNPTAQLLQCLCGGEKGEKKKTYRGAQELPKETVRLIKGMTHPMANRRTTVRMARLYPWINDVLDGDRAPYPRNVQFLKRASSSVVAVEPQE